MLHRVEIISNHDKYYVKVIFDHIKKNVKHVEIMFKSRCSDVRVRKINEHHIEIMLVHLKIKLKHVQIMLIKL